MHGQLAAAIRCAEPGWLAAKEAVQSQRRQLNVLESQLTLHTEELVAIAKRLHIASRRSWCVTVDRCLLLSLSPGRPRLSCWVARREGDGFGITRSAHEVYLLQLEDYLYLTTSICRRCCPSRRSGERRAPQLGTGISSGPLVRGSAPFQITHPENGKRHLSGCQLVRVDRCRLFQLGALNLTKSRERRRRRFLHCSRSGWFIGCSKKFSCSSSDWPLGNDTGMRHYSNKAINMAAYLSTTSKYDF